MSKEAINSLGISVKQGNHGDLKVLLDELEGNIHKFAMTFYQEWRGVINEDFEDICSILHYEVFRACMDYNPSLGDLLSRIYDFWRQKLSGVINHYKWDKRNKRKYHTESFSNCDVDDGNDCYQPVLDEIFISQLCKDEKQLIALNGVIEGKTFRQIVRENPSVFKHHNEAKKALEEVYRTYKAAV